MIDSHAHVSFEQFDDDRPQVIDNMSESGVTGWVEVGTDLEQSRAAIELVGKHDSAWATVGVHPSDIEELNNQSWAEVESLFHQPKVVAVGEVGFDFYRGGQQSDQEPVLRRFINLALQKDLPVIFHVRSGEDVDAHEALLGLFGSLDQVPRGVIHTYSGSVEQAKRYLDLGLYLSFSGVVTFKNAGELIEVVKQVPADKYLVETDCPFLAPEPYRGQRNEPAYVKYVVAKLADVRGESFEQIDQQSDANTRKLFGLK